MRGPQEDLRGCGVGCEAWAEPLMSSSGWGRWQEGGRAVPCGVSTDCTSPLTEDHLGRFQTHVTVRMKQSLPSAYSINCVEYVSSTGVQSSALFIPCSIHPPIQPAICSSIHPSLIHPSIHPTIHSLTQPIISDPLRRQTPPPLLLPGGPPA